MGVFDKRLPNVEKIAATPASVTECNCEKSADKLAQI